MKFYLPFSDGFDAELINFPFLQAWLVGLPLVWHGLMLQKNFGESLRLKHSLEKREREQKAKDQRVTRYRSAINLPLVGPSVGCS